MQYGDEPTRRRDDVLTAEPEPPFRWRNTPNAHDTVHQTGR